MDGQQVCSSGQSLPISLDNLSMLSTLMPSDELLASSIDLGMYKYNDSSFINSDLGNG